MTAPRRAVLRPWVAPLAFSAAVHAAALGGAVGLQGLVQPPRPESVIPVDLVFAVAPATARGPAANAAAGVPPSLSASEPVPIPAAARREAAGPAPPPPAVPVPPATRAGEQPLQHPPPVVGQRTREPQDRRPEPAYAAKRTPPEIHRVALGVPPPPLPRRKPKPPPDPVAVAALERSAADKAADPVPAGIAGAARRAADDETAAPAPQASLTPPAQATPPGWGAPGLANAPPRYPLAARRRGDEGRVVLRVRVSADGRAETVTVAKSSGHALLDEAAQRAVARWRFVPGRLAGLPVAAALDVPVTFRLKD
jgi:protein TonB